jgi:hypothetical protein
MYYAREIKLWTRGGGKNFCSQELQIFWGEDM